MTLPAWLPKTRGWRFRISFECLPYLSSSYSSRAMVEVRLILLELNQAVNQGFRSRRTTRHINVYRHDAVGTAHNGIRIVIIAAAVGTRAHRQYPARLGELVAHAAQGGCHFAGQRTATIIRSAWRGDGRKMMPKRSRSLTRHTRCIISTPQQAAECNQPQRTYMYIVQHRIRAGGDETFFKTRLFPFQRTFFHS